MQEQRRSRRLCRPACFSVWALSCAVLTGCGSDYPATAEVEGRVTYAGKPLSGGRILFWPPKGRPAMAEIGPDGTYSLTTFLSEDGALLGEHRVTIKATRVRFDEARGDIPRRSPAEATESPPRASGRAFVEWLVPQRYERPESSPLTATVQPGKNTIDFDLPAEE